MSNRQKRESVCLLIEVGNSNTDFALATREKIQKIISVPTDQLSKIPFSTKRIKGIVLASVVPAVTKKITRWLSMRPLVVDSKIDLGIRLRYPNTKQLGADRLANAVAVANLYRTPAIAVDFGTATTFDVINQKKEFIGGIIAPGITAMKDYLHQKTAQLPKVSLAEPKSVIGKSTVSAMRSGIVIGYRGLVKEILEQLMNRYELRNAVVVATGGYGKRIAHLVPTIKIVNPLLTLEGLRFIYLRNLRDSD